MANTASPGPAGAATRFGTAGMPTQDPRCQSPCDPVWRTRPTCIIFNETRRVTLPLGAADTVAAFARGQVVVSVTCAHSLCLVGRQHGGLACTLTLLPGEKMNVYQSDRYRRTTCQTERHSVQTTFSQFVSALHKQQNSRDSNALQQVLNSQTSSSNVGASGGINLGLSSLGGSGGSSSSSSSSSINSLAVQASSDRFVSPVLTPGEIGQIPASLRQSVEAALITGPTDGVVCDPELAHRCAQDPELEQADCIRLQREHAQAQRMAWRFS